MSEPYDLSAMPEMAPTFRLQWEEAQNGYVILYPEGMIKLNPAAGEILRRCDGAHTVAALIDDLKRQFPDAENLSNDVLTFLGTAHEHQWIRDKSA